MSGRTTAACTAAVLGLLLTACSDDGGGSKADKITGLPSEVPAATGPVDSVSWNLPYGEPGSIDPVFSYDQASSPVVSNMCESLLTFDDGGNLAPNLASEWEQPDASTVILTLQDGVTFWDGKPMTAQDVTYSLGRNTEPSVGSFWGYPWFTNVSSIEATGDNEITIKLKEPDSVFTQILATNAGQISEQDYVESKGDKYGTSSGGLMCTGPFMFDTWKPGDSLTMKKNPNYWNSDGEAQAETFTFSFISDPSTLTNALVTGELDGSNYVPVSAVDKLKDTSSGTLYGASSLQFDYMLFSSKQGPLLEADVRKAISLTLDRQAIADSIYKSAATAAWSTASASGPDAFESINSKLPGNKVDLEEAKSLVEGASVDTSATLQLAVPSENPVSVQIATYAQSALAQIGLKVEIKKLPFSDFVPTLLGGPEAAAAYDAYILPGYLDFPDPIGFYIVSALPTALLNILQQEDPTMIDLIGQARATTDETERKDLNGPILEAGGETNQTLVLSAPNMLTFMGDGFTGSPLDSYSILSTPWAASVGASER